MQVGLIGFGTIGRALAEAIQTGTCGPVDLATVLVRNLGKITAADRATYGDVFTDLPNVLLDGDLVLIVEAAGHQALAAYGAAALTAGKDLMTVSVGAFADESLYQAVCEAAATSGRQVLVPSGAIGGLDAISAAALGPIESASHTTRKHPRAFSEAQLGGGVPTEPRVLYDGPASEGVQRFPENVNVAAAVSLAGVGLARTRLCVIADPRVERNTHEVEVQGYFGRIRIQMENIPTENPKTGRIVALSIAKALRNRSAPVVVGL
jgi:aspartate dehydrogenase